MKVSLLWDCYQILANQIVVRVLGTLKDLDSGRLVDFTERVSKRVLVQSLMKD